MATQQYTRDGLQNLPGFRELFDAIDNGMLDADLSDIDPYDEHLNSAEIYPYLPSTVKTAIDQLLVRLDAYGEMREAAPSIDLMSQAKSAMTRAGARITPVRHPDNQYYVVKHAIKTPGGHLIII